MQGLHMFNTQVLRYSGRKRRGSGGGGRISKVLRSLRTYRGPEPEAGGATSLRRRESTSPIEEGERGEGCSTWG